MIKRPRKSSDEFQKLPSTLKPAWTLYKNMAFFCGMIMTVSGATYPQYGRVSSERLSSNRPQTCPLHSLIPEMIIQEA